MKRTLLHICAVAAAATLGTQSWSETIIFDPGNVGIDTLENINDEAIIDLNQDGVDDIRLSIGVNVIIGPIETANVDTLRDTRFTNGPGDGTAPTEFIAPYQQVYLSMDGSVADLFAPGDSVGLTTFGSLGLGERLYGATGSPTLPLVGDSGWLGFRIDTGLSRYLRVDGDGFGSGYLNRGFTETPESFYGFLYVEHGSILFGQAGYNPVAGQAAVIPGIPPVSTVPLPAGSFLLIGGLAGIGALRRRKNG